MFNYFISGCFRAVGAGLRQQVEPQEMLPPPPPGLGGEQEGCAGGGSVPRQVRLETSHWSRSIQILCFDWLASRFYYAIKIQFKASKAPYVSGISCLLLCLNGIRVASMQGKDLL